MRAGKKLALYGQERPPSECQPNGIHAAATASRPRQQYQYTTSWLAALEQVEAVAMHA